MLFKRRCPNCSRDINRSWNFCPFCGYPLKEKPRSIFEDIEREFERIDKMFSSELFRLPKFDIKPFRGGGISITITSGTGREPQIKVRTSGDYKKLEPEIKRKLGIKTGIKEVETIKRPKITEEPEAKIEKMGNKEKIEIKLPGVKRIEDIEIRKLEQSIEIKAFAKDKVYFKLIPVPKGFIITEKEFKDETLRLEVGW
jgi:HSP20 family molecular chaperone IbpA